MERDVGCAACRKYQQMKDTSNLKVIDLSQQVNVLQREMSRLKSESPAGPLLMIHAHGVRSVSLWRSRVRQYMGVSMIRGVASGKCVWKHNICV